MLVHGLIDIALLVEVVAAPVDQREIPDGRLLTREAGGRDEPAVGPEGQVVFAIGLRLFQNFVGNRVGLGFIAVDIVQRVVAKALEVVVLGGLFQNRAGLRLPLHQETVGETLHPAWVGRLRCERLAKLGERFLTKAKRGARQRERGAVFGGVQQELATDSGDLARL